MPNNTLEIACLLEALQNTMDAHRSHDEARERYIEGGGYSWGYYGQEYIEACERAELAFQERLSAVIDARIQAALAAGVRGPA